MSCLTEYTVNKHQSPGISAGPCIGCAIGPMARGVSIWPGPEQRPADYNGVYRFPLGADLSGRCLLAQAFFSRNEDMMYGTMVDHRICQYQPRHGPPA